MWALRETGGRRTSVLLKAPQMFTIGYGFYTAQKRRSSDAN
jgi:hypothetical protein